MKGQKLIQLFICACLIPILSVSCGGTQNESPETESPTQTNPIQTDVAPTSTPTTIPPTPTLTGVILTPIPSGIGGGWVTEPGRSLTISLYTSEGELLALVKINGTVEWDADGRLTEGAENFAEIQTAANLDHWYDIVDWELQDGLLSITAEESVYTYFEEASSLTPSSRETQVVTINEDGNWEGKASFFITGFQNFDAYIYQDIRNYDIQQ